MHKKSCGKRIENERRDAEYEQSLRKQAKERFRQISESYSICYFALSFQHREFAIFIGRPLDYNNENDTANGAYGAIYKTILIRLRSSKYGPLLRGWF